MSGPKRKTGGGALRHPHRSAAPFVRPAIGQVLRQVADDADGAVPTVEIEVMRSALRMMIWTSEPPMKGQPRPRSGTSSEAGASDKRGPAESRDSSAGVRLFGHCLFPKLTGDLHWIDAGLLPRCRPPHLQRNLSPDTISWPRSDLLVYTSRFVANGHALAAAGRAQDARRRARGPR